MAKIIANSGVTVELSAREVKLIREALRFAVENKGGWYPTDDADASDLERVLAGGTE